MSTHRLRTVLDHAYRMAGRPADTDARLLARYTSLGDEAAFTELVRRHGPLVLGVCRRALRCPADVDDAFQATFLVLARRAATIRRPASLPSWLHGVAWRVAAKLRAPTAAEPLSDALPDASADPVRAAAWRELCGMLDEELHRLPERLRGPLVLCYLEGRTRDEAAVRLGYSPSTLKRRLERGRELLKMRLTRRGVTLGAALTSAALGELPASATVPARLLALATSPASVRATQVATAVLTMSAGVKLPLAVVGVLAVVLGLGAGIGQRDETPPAQPPLPAVAVAKAPATDRFGDPLPPGAFARFGTMRYRHGGFINDAALSPDGRTIAVASWSVIALYDLETGRQLRVLQELGLVNGFIRSASKLAFAPHGKAVAATLSDTTIRVWDVATGRELRQFGTARPFGWRGTQRVVVPDDFNRGGIQFTRDGRQLVGSTQEATYFFDLESGQTVRRLDLAGRPVGLAADPNGLLMLDNADEHVALLDVQTGQEQRRFVGRDKVGSAAVSSDGKTIIIADQNGEVRLWDIVSGQVLASVQIALPPPLVVPFISRLALAPDGRTLFVGTARGEILRRQIPGGQELPSLRAHHFRGITGMLFPPGGRMLVSVGTDNVIRRWNLADGQQLPTGDGYAEYLKTALSPDGKVLAAGDSVGRLDLWDVATGERVHALRSSGLGVSNLAFAPDGRTLAAGQEDAAVTLWDLAARKELRSLLPVRPNPGSTFNKATFIKFSPDGRRLLTYSLADRLGLWEVADGKEVWRRPLGNFEQTAFAPDGRTIVTGGQSKVLTFLDAENGQDRLTVPSENEPNNAQINALVFSPDGRFLVNSQRTGVICIRDPQTGQELKRINVPLAGMTVSVPGLSFSKDGRWLMGGCMDHTVRIWETATWQEVQCLKGHQGLVIHTVFRPDGRTALSTSDDLTALLWNLRPADVKGVKGNEEVLWTDLAGDGPTGYRAVWSLLDDPATAADLLGRKLAPARSTLDVERVRNLIADLDKDDFRTRETAVKALADLGPAAEVMLRDALRQAKSPEATQRLRQLVERLKHEPTADELRIGRSVQALELCGTPEARAVLRRWADGDAGALLTEESRVALGRLERTR